MLLLNQQSCSSIRLTDSFGWQSNEAIDHQDVHELNRLLFDAIQKSLQGTKQSNLIRLCYEGSTINYTQCKQCQKIFKRIVIIYFLNKIFFFKILFVFRKIIKIYH